MPRLPRPHEPATHRSDTCVPLPDKATSPPTRSSAQRSGLAHEDATKLVMSSNMRTPGPCPQRRRHSHSCVTTMAVSLHRHHSSPRAQRAPSPHQRSCPVLVPSRPPWTTTSGAPLTLEARLARAPLECDRLAAVYRHRHQGGPVEVLQRPADDRPIVESDSQPLMSPAPSSRRQNEKRPRPLWHAPWPCLPAWLRHAQRSAHTEPILLRNLLRLVRQQRRAIHLQQVALALEVAISDRRRDNCLRGLPRS